MTKKIGVSKVAKKLKVSEATVYGRIHSPNPMPHYYENGHYKFILSEVLPWWEKNRRWPTGVPRRRMVPWPLPEFTDVPESEFHAGVGTQEAAEIYKSLCNSNEYRTVKQIQDWLSNLASSQQIPMWKPQGEYFILPLHMEELARQFNATHPVANTTPESNTPTESLEGLQTEMADLKNMVSNIESRQKNDAHEQSEKIVFLSKQNELKTKQIEDLRNQVEYLKNQVMFLTECLDAKTSPDTLLP